ncbi:MAG: HAD family hydrolase [Alphaproteobacteria bacterium]
MTKYIIVWDWNNTLVSTAEASYLALKDVAKAYGTLPVSRDEVMTVIGTHRAYWHQMFGAKEEEAVAFYLNRYASYRDTIKVMDGAPEVLAYVRSLNIPQVVLSNEWIHLLNEEMACTGLAPYFDAIQGTVDAHGKPEKSFVKRVLKGFSYDKVIVIGDGLSDMQTARVLQAVSIAVFDTLPLDVAADYRCADLWAVRRVLERLLADIRAE